MGIGKACLSGGEQHIAGERQLETAGDRRAVDRADHRTTEAADRAHRVVDLHGVVHRGSRRRDQAARAQLLQVEPGGEGPAGAGQDQHPHLGVGLQGIDGPPPFAFEVGDSRVLRGLNDAIVLMTEVIA